MNRLMTALGCVLFASSCTMFSSESCELYEPERVDGHYPALRSDWTRGSDQVLPAGATDGARTVEVGDDDTVSITYRLPDGREVAETWAIVKRQRVRLSTYDNRILARDE